MTTALMKLWMRLFGIKFGKGFKTKGWFFIMKNRGGLIKIGKQFRVHSSMLSSLVGVYQRVVIVARRNGTIEIGDNVGITGGTIHGSDVKIGNNVMIGANTKIMDHDFHSLDYIERRTDAREHAKSKPVRIGDDVFIGCNSIILKGTHIGNRCIVGAGSVVSGVFEDDCLIAGNPAKVVRRINQQTP